MSGDRVALVSPAGPPDFDRVARGIELLESWGLRVSHEPFDRDGFLAASDRDRKRSVQCAFDDPDVRAVLCTRGGYGSQRIVDDLNVDGFVTRRAAFVGFSDTTALHAKLNQAGLATFYGPPLAWDVERNGDVARESLKEALFSREATAVAVDTEEDSVTATTDGVAEGQLVGGNLSILGSCIGTPTQIDPRGRVLFFEEVNEPLRKVDRTLTQLSRAGLLEDLAAVVIGQLTSCCSNPGDQSMDDVLRSRVGGLGVPVLAGIPAGHGQNQRTIPLGAKVVVDATARELRWLM